LHTINIAKIKGGKYMNDATLFRRAFGVAIILGVMSRLIVLRVINKQQPTLPQDYIEQLI